MSGDPHSHTPPAGESILLLLQQLARVQGQAEQDGDREGGQLVSPACWPASAWWWPPRMAHGQLLLQPHC
ncbi:hypothetical protein O3P69_000344 [Scylla paramamosain]|uniref:Uncharacterized protein n=1 Tax=Scylla paramamosain TaxID=85552 RepID=A0AAW0UWC7_SCYPA